MELQKMDFSTLYNKRGDKIAASNKILSRVWLRTAKLNANTVDHIRVANGTNSLINYE